MRLIIICVGRLKQGPERELAERYRERFCDVGRKLGFRGLEVHEIPESRAREQAVRKTEEAAVISALLPENHVLVALDERGENLDSESFAGHIGRWRDQSVANTIFLIGGADGLSPELRGKAKLRVAFGSATWPHQMVRVMLLEQLYRAATILAGQALKRSDAAEARHPCLLREPRPPFRVAALCRLRRVPTSAGARTDNDACAAGSGRFAR
jgi:23S rRNA (pseudouridine1915-N3)-methyltransferase